MSGNQPEKPKYGLSLNLNFILNLTVASPGSAYFQFRVSNRC